MKVTGFSFIRNAIKYDYPVVESVLSVLPLCDEFVMAVGDSEDGTEDLVRSINPDKIRIIPTVWDEDLRTGGAILAQQTNTAFRAISKDTDWAFYIQGDEVLPEYYHDMVREGMQSHFNDHRVDGLLFRYRHFYGSYAYIGASPRWYRREVRIIRNDPSIYSYQDAQGFRKGNNQKLRVKPLEAFIHHYGWVKNPEVVTRKMSNFHRWWHDDNWLRKYEQENRFDYYAVDKLEKFRGEHPEVMKKRIRAQNWKFEFDPNRAHMKVKDRIRYWVESRTGWLPFEYRNYRII